MGPVSCCGPPSVRVADAVRLESARCCVRRSCVWAFALCAGAACLSLRECRAERRCPARPAVCASTRGGRASVRCGPASVLRPSVRAPRLSFAAAGRFVLSDWPSLLRCVSAAGLALFNLRYAGLSAVCLDDAGRFSLCSSRRRRTGEAHPHAGRWEMASAQLHSPLVSLCSAFARGLGLRASAVLVGFWICRVLLQEPRNGGVGSPARRTRPSLQFSERRRGLRVLPVRRKRSRLRLCKPKPARCGMPE